MIFLTALSFIVIFSILILVHEWGHFYFARKAGIKVEEFGIGLPPRAKKIYKDKKGPGSCCHRSELYRYKKANLSKL